VAPLNPRGTWFEHTLIYGMSESFLINFNFPSPLVFHQKILKDISYVKTSKNSFYYCGPTQLLGVIILTNLILFYVIKLSFKFQLFWRSGSSEEYF
jgi:hypothetical protein